MRRKTRNRKNLVKRIVKHLKQQLKGAFERRAKLKTKFKLVQQNCARKGTQILTLRLRQLKALKQRSSRKRRNGLRVVRIRRQWRRRAVRRRFRRFQKHDTLTRRQFWRRTSRDKFTMQRFQLYYSNKAAVLGSTAALQKGYHNFRGLAARTHHAANARQFFARGAGGMHSPASALRVNLRRLVLRRGNLSKKPKFFAESLGRRLDMRIRRLAPKHFSQAVSLPAFTQEAQLRLLSAHKISATAQCTSLKSFRRTRRYHALNSVRSLQKLRIQQQLRNATLPPVNAGSSTLASAPDAANRLLLRSRGRYLSAAGARLTAQRTDRQKALTGFAAALTTYVSAPIVASLPAQYLNNSLVKRLPRANTKQAVQSPRFGFLNKISKTIKNHKYTVRRLRAQAVLHREQRYYRAARIIHRRPQMRLPDTAVTRQRRRKSGLVAFVRNSLKRPKTLLGRKQLFLPPAAPFRSATKVFGFSHAPTRATLRAYTQRDETLPIFWTRPHNRANRDAVARVKRKKYKKFKRATRIERGKGYRRRHGFMLGQEKQLDPLPQDASLASAVAMQAAATGLWLHRLRTAALPSTGTQAIRRLVKFSSARKRKQSKKVWRLQPHLTAQRPTLRQVTSRQSRTNHVTALLLETQSVYQAKVQSLTQVRSVQAMLAAERGFSAWAPQLSARSRRKHYPRVEGIPLSRKRLSFGARRNRNIDNAARLRRGVPQRRYTDHTRVRLQYYYGSVGTAGYPRFRRVYRAHSDHSRWWRPTLRPVPFAHPYSRRNLNATKYQRSANLNALIPATRSFVKLIPPQREVTLQVKVPARQIPWRNFHYRKPRHGDAPKTVQRWTYVARRGKFCRVSPSVTPLVLAKSSRQLHNLHKYVSARGAYKNHHWGALDRATLNAAYNTQFRNSIAQIPASVWAALSTKLGSSSVYVQVRTRIFNQFKAWLRKRQLTEPTFSSAGVAQAQTALIELIRVEMAARKVATMTDFKAKRHGTLRQAAFNTHVQHKSLQYLKLRELPKVGAVLAPDYLLRREQSRIYKRWLAGVESALKRTQTTYTPTKRSRYTENVSTNFGRRRTRFPASGRRRKSYDSLLHAFAKKVSPGRFRRAAKLRFRWAHPKLSGNFQENIATLTPMFGSNRRRHTAKKLTAVAYLSPNMRELLEYREISAATSAITKAPIKGVKRRFMALPTHRVFANWRRTIRKKAQPTRHLMHSIRFSILRRALRRRRRTRAYVDLRISVRQRRLPREKPSSFRRRRRRGSLRRKFAVRRGRFSRKNARKRRKQSIWTLRHLSAVGTRWGKRRKQKLPAILPNGENVSIRKTLLRRRTRAVRGFVLPTNSRRRLRRLPRDTIHSKRRSRRKRLSVRRKTRRRTRHWSERRLNRYRQVAHGYKRISLAKTFSTKLSGKFSSRHFSGRSRGAKVSLLKLFSVSANSTTQLRTSIATIEPTARELEAQSYSHDRGRVWLLRNQSRFARRRYRSSEVDGIASRRHQLETALSALRERTISSLPARLVSAVTSFSVTTPLWFEPPVTRVVKSAAIKKQEALAAIAAKEGTFRLPAQYAEGVTVLLPGLINFMLSQKLQSKKITYQVATHMIRNIYWSLRVYLNVDPFDSRFFVRDKVPAARVRLFEEIFELSKHQKTQQPDRAILRYRLQPSKLIRAKSTQRFREDWLRAFFPARHALYQENAEDYGKFLVSTHRIRRLRIGPSNMQSWKTMASSVGLESRSRQLLRLRFSRRHRRLETLLQTTRREPTRELAPAAPNSSSRISFFTRQYSTFTNRGLVMTSRWIHRQKRFVTLEDGWRRVTPASQVTTRRKLVSRLEARGRTRYVATRWKSVTTSLLDARFARVKSPRSRQYLIRSHKNFAQTSTEKKLTDLSFYRNLANKRLFIDKPSVTRWTCARRRTWSFAFKSVAAADSLTDLRQDYARRRAQSTLFARKNKKLITGQPKTIRSILHYRAPLMRTSAVTYRRAPALIFDSVAAHSTYRMLQETHKHSSTFRTRAQRFKRFLGRRWTVFPKKLGINRPRLGVTRVNNSTVSTGVRQKRNYFGPIAGLHVGDSMDMARAAAMYKRLQRQTPFETFRPNLWNKLTLRWKKKLRIGRYWIRETSHWLRDPWLSKIVATDMSLRRDRFGGELRSRAQKVGEYVADVDASGRDIPRKNAPKERHKFEQTVLPEKEDLEIKRTIKVLAKGSNLRKTIALHRLFIAKQARRKPVPSMFLANFEYRDVIREHKEELAKSAQQKAEEEQTRIKAYWSRKARKLPPARPRRLPLKHPANLWLPHAIWKDIQRRIRKFEWRESDQVFARRGFRNAFKFRPNERRKAYWLEPLLYTRSTYSTRLRAFRRRQFPHEQKKFKWLQRVRKQLYPGQRRRFIKRKRWSQLGRYSQKLHYSLFDLRDRSAARRHFKKLNGRSKPAVSAFVSHSKGLTDRLDITCLQMRFAPTIYWARIVSEFGLLRVNGVTVYDPSFRLQPGDIIQPNWDTAARFQHYFKPYLSRRQERRRRNKKSTACYPRNMEYDRGTQTIVYKHAPEESDLRKYGRIRPRYLRWFKLDSV
jgi:ribosomal protein S4